MPAIALPHSRLYYVRSAPPAPRYPTVILIHGAGGTHLDWPPEIRRLPAAVTVALDLAGHGKSSGEGHADVLPHARDIIALVEALGLPHAILIGHSMGGAIAQLAALQAPERVAGLVLIGTGSRLPIAPALLEQIAVDPIAAVDRMMKLVWGPAGSLALQQLGRQRLLSVSPALLERDYRACQAFDSRPQLEQITAPTLVIAGAEDRVVPLKFSRTLAETIPGAMLVIVPHAGHMLPLEQPQAVRAALESWLAEQTW